MNLAQASREFGQRLRATGHFDFVGNGAQALCRNSDQVAVSGPAIS